jgi:hypothetical protein
MARATEEEINMTFDNPSDLVPGFNSTLPDELNPFWYDLEQVLAAAKPFTSLQMAEFLHDYRGAWFRIQADIHENPALGKMFEQALTIRDSEF